MATLAISRKAPTIQVAEEVVASNRLICVGLESPVLERRRASAMQGHDAVLVLRVAFSVSSMAIVLTCHGAFSGL